MAASGASGGAETCDATRTGTFRWSALCSFLAVAALGRDRRSVDLDAAFEAARERCEIWADVESFELRFHQLPTVVLVAGSLAVDNGLQIGPHVLDRTQVRRSSSPSLEDLHAA